MRSKCHAESRYEECRGKEVANRESKNPRIQESGMIIHPMMRLNDEEGLDVSRSRRGLAGHPPRSMLPLHAPSSLLLSRGVVVDSLRRRLVEKKLPMQGRINVTSHNRFTTDPRLTLAAAASRWGVLSLLPIAPSHRSFPTRVPQTESLPPSIE